MFKRFNRFDTRSRARPMLGLALTLGLAMSAALAGEEPGVTAATLRVGAIMPLAGDNEVYGLNLKRGIEAALAGQSAQGRKLGFMVANDFGEPITTLEVGNKLLETGVFAMLGNVGTLTTLKLMPMLTANRIPAVGFYTAGEVGNTNDMLNFRPSHAQEVAELMAAAASAGVKPARFCAFLQNDAYGLAGIEGLKIGLGKLPETQPIIAKLDQIVDMTMGGINPALNGLGPVGFYRRGASYLRDGYQSLKAWEQATGETCQWVTLVAAPKVAADFIAYARYKNEPWVFAAISTTVAGDELTRLLRESGVKTRLIATQVVPPLNAPLPVLGDAYAALGVSLNPLNLEGFIVGRMFLTILRTMNGPLTRENFLKTARRQPFDIGGLRIDFTSGNPGSRLLLLTALDNNQVEVITAGDLPALLKN